jgi:replication initiation and membrane attachment protein DnaB
MARIFLSIEGIKQDLKQGVTRLQSDPNYDSNLGSIQEKYGLSKTQVQNVFKDPRLKGLKTIKPKAETEIVFQEDVPVEAVAVPVGSQPENFSTTEESIVAISESSSASQDSDFFNDDLQDQNDATETENITSDTDENLF